MPRITIADQNRTIDCPVGKTLFDALRDAGIHVDSPCGGSRICGKCKIEVLEGETPAPTSSDRRLLSGEERDKNCRLACSFRPIGDVTVRLPSPERKHRILASGFMPKFQFAPAVRKKIFDISKSDLQSGSPLEDIVARAVGTDKPGLLSLRSLSVSPGRFTAVYSEECLIGIEKDDTTDRIYGLAVDIGTTTLIAALVDLGDGRELGAETDVNPQSRHGTDVLSRVSYVMRHGKEGRDTLQKEVVGALYDMVRRLCESTGIEPRFIYDVAVSANTIMMHLLLGVDPASMGFSPFMPVFVRGRSIRTADIGLNLAADARIRILPSVSAYIGADAVAGIYVCGMDRRKENILFIDIGTNGEIALARGGRILACSCAAGPALEGMGLRCGMRAADGAIEDVFIRNGHVDLKIVGDTEPAGICGSGILAAVRELLHAGLLDENGRLLSEDELATDDPHRFLLRTVDGQPAVCLSASADVVVTQKDIRQIQLAKGALAAGLHALLEEAQIAPADIEKIWVAGQFGKHLPPESLTGCGILPAFLKERIQYLGNSAQSGAYMALMSIFVRKSLERLAKSIDYVELSSTKGYEKRFLECLYFPSR